MSSPGSGSFWRELRRRHVIRVAVMYAAGVFVVLQAADLVFPALGLPEWSFRLLVLSSLLAFPLVLVVAWVFDLTPEGVQRTEEGEGHSGVGRTARLSLLVLTAGLGLGAIALSYRWARGTSGTGAADRRTVAVLPFETFGDDAETAVFGAGLHDDVLSHLARIPALRVISRTSVIQYAGATKTLPEIGRELGAGTILEGSVRRSGDSIRVVLQLVDAEGDAHLWSETYDRPLADVFQVQSEIASAVARALEAELSDAQRAQMAAAPTEDLEAYGLFQQGRIRFERRENRVDAEEAVRLFQEAVDLDPEFAMAWAALSEARMWLFSSWPEHAGQATLAADALARAEALAPEAPQTRLAQGYFEVRGNGDYSRALEHFEAAATLAPGDALPLEAIGFVHRRMGDWEQAVQYLGRAFQGNPRSYGLAFDLGQTYARLRRVEDAERYFRVATTVAPELPAAYDARLRLHLAVAGDTAKVRTLLPSAPPAVAAEFRSRLAAAAGEWDQALTHARAARPDDRAQLGAYYRLVGTLLHAAGRWDARGAYGDSLMALAGAFLEGSTSSRTGFSRPELTAGAHGDLGVAHALRSVRMRAIREGATAAALLPIERNAFRGPDQLQTLVEIYVLVGEYETALEEIEGLLSIPSGLSPAGMAVDPLFAPLHDHPGYADRTGAAPDASEGAGGR